MPKKKKDEITEEEVINNMTESEINTADNQIVLTDGGSDITESESNITDVGSDDITGNEKNGAEIKKAKPRAPRGRDRPIPILAIDDGGEAESPEDRSDQIWYEIQNARRTKKILSGIISGIEKMELEYDVAVVDYHGFRIAIPMNNMIADAEIRDSYKGEEPATRKSKLVGNMLGAEVDFIVNGIDRRTRSVVGSRVEAMRKKRRLFYMTPDRSGKPKIYKGRIVQARVIAVAEKSIWIEAFGAVCPINARDLSREWVGNAAEKYSIGDKIVVKIIEINRGADDNISIRADVRSLTETVKVETLCKVQGRYAGQVTDIYEGIYFIRLAVGADAVAHACYDSKMPCKKDVVSFTVTEIDTDRNEAGGIISKIIKSKYI